MVSWIRVEGRIWKSHVNAGLSGHAFQGVGWAPVVFVLCVGSSCIKSLGFEK